jgi:hypothetical protein
VPGAVAEFLGRYGVLLLVLGTAVTINVLRLRRHFRRKREIYDPALTPDWSERRNTFVSEGAVGRWQGREVRLRRLRGMEKRFDVIEVSAESPASGAFLVERKDVGVLRRQFRIGGPPAIEPIDPADQRKLRVLSHERSVPDRLLADSGVRALLYENLWDSGDEISLRKGRLRVVRRIPRDQAAALAVRNAWALLKEAARVLG